MDLLKRRSLRRDEDRTRPSGRPPAATGVPTGTPVSPAPTAAPEAPIDEPPGRAREVPTRGVDAPLDRPAHRIGGPDRDRDGVDDRAEARAAGSGTVFDSPADDPAHRRTVPTPVATSDDTAEQRRTEPDRDRDLATAYEEGRAAERREQPDRVVEDVVVTRWSIADLVVTLVGVALTVVGALGLARAEVNDTWFSPVVDVVGANHTALLAAAELGAGVLIILAGVARRRVLATLFGLALAVLGVIAAIESAEVERELAIEDWWAWVLVAAGALVVLMGLVPRKGRIRRVATTER
jgi:hypothetical protein